VHIKSSRRTKGKDGAWSRPRGSDVARHGVLSAARIGSRVDVEVRRAGKLQRLAWLEPSRTEVTETAEEQGLILLLAVLIGDCAAHA